MTTQTITGATVFLPEDVVETSVTLSDGLIAEIGGPVQGRRIDGRGLMLAPALIDIHGDAFERQIMPRPGVFFPMDVAVLDTDRQLAANGIATTYHALTLSWEPGLRSVARGRDFLSALNRLAPRLTVENRVQLRWETFAFEAVEMIEAALDGPLTPAVAFNDHTSMSMRAFDVSVQDRLFEHNPDFALADPDDPRMSGRLKGSAARAGLSDGEYLSRLKDIWARRDQVPGVVAGLAAQAQARGAAMLSHDDTQAETRAWYRNLGVRVSEFPMRAPAAEDARAHGDLIAFGAPNVVRGGSHIGSLAAADMVEAGMCDVLASDYFYPAMLAAITRLDAERRAARPDLWKLVSTGPARAMNLRDRGEIRQGQRADLVLVDWPENAAPAVRATYSKGRCAYAAAPPGV